VLGITGWLIAHPTGVHERQRGVVQLLVGQVRFVHFVAAHVFAANFVFRLYWAFAGNDYANWRNFFRSRAHRFPRSATCSR